MTDIVERVEKIVEEANQDHPMTFAALVEPADSEVTSYDLIVSSPWFLKEGKLRSYTYLNEKLKKYLNKDDWMDFNRVLLMSPEEKFIQDLSNQAGRFKVRDLSDVRAGGINLRYAHIFVAQPEAAPVPLRSFN
jgi:hypothetical protein